MANLERTRAQRLDQHVVERFPRLSRSYATKLIVDEKVKVNGVPQKAGYKLRLDDEVTIDFDEAILDAIPQIDLPVLFEDENVIVVNKPEGVISHARGKYWDEPSVASFVRDRVHQEMQGERAGIVHRLDRATSGVMICAKNELALKFLQKQFNIRNVHKTYIAVVPGHLDPREALIDLPIERNPKAPALFRVGANGKAAKTKYKVLQESATHSLVELSPETGRTHQLRVHLKHISHPIVGDPLYSEETYKRLLLHAQELEITLPGGERKVFTSPLPTDFMEVMKA